MEEVKALLMAAGALVILRAALWGDGRRSRPVPLPKPMSKQWLDGQKELSSSVGFTPDDF